MRKRRSMILVLALVLILTSLGSSMAYAGDNELVSVTINGKNMKLHKVSIVKDGKILETDAPGFVYVDRTLVPIRLIIEAYGGEVKWSQKTKTAKVIYGDKTLELTINSDIAKVNGRPVKLDSSSVARMANYGTAYGTTMVPMAFISEQLGYVAKWDAVNKAVYLEEDATGDIKDPSETDEQKVGANKISNIYLSKDKKSVVIDGAAKAKIKTMKLKNPDRMVLDILDSELKYNKTSLNEKIGLVKGLRFSQFAETGDFKKERTVRVVFDMEAGGLDSKMDLSRSQKSLVVTPEEVSGESIVLGSNSLSIPTIKKTTYSVDYNNSRMLVRIPKGSADLRLEEKIHSNPLVRGTKVYETKAETIVEILFRSPISYSLLTANPSKGIGIKFEKDNNTKPNKPTGRTIMLDPGHGGHDPGAVSDGYFEKHIALATSLKLRDELESRGYKVIMTRQLDEEFYTVTERWKMANELNPDVFLSVHVNSASTRKAQGIETLHAYKPENPNKGQKQLDFSNAIQSEVIKTSGAVNRGLKDGGWVGVLRNTQMTSALIELGFMPNVEERSKLLTDSYQYALAEGMANGIDKYFEKY